jgi:hypothetical protein
MTRQQLSALIDTLPPALKVRREHVLRTRRGHERLVAPGAGTKAKLTPADGILVTALHLRKLATTDPSTSSPASPMTISRAKQGVRPLLEEHGHNITASTARLRLPSDITTFPAAEPAQSKIKSAG